MQTSFIIAGALAVGVLVGATTSYVVFAPPPPIVEAPPQRGPDTLDRSVVVAAIEDDPGLCEIVSVPKPSHSEAQIALNKALKSSPLSYNSDSKPDATIELGQCDKNASGPGIACMTSIRYTPQQQEPQNRLVGFAKNGEGEWAATLY